MNAPHVTEKLALWAGGDLPEGEMLSIKAHLDSCLACKAEADAYTGATSWLQTPSELPFSHAERANIRNEVMAEIRKSNKSNARRVMPWLMAAASTLAAMLLYSAYNENRNTGPSARIAQTASHPSPQTASPAPLQNGNYKQDYEQIHEQSAPSQAQPPIKNAANTPAKRRAPGYYAKSQPNSPERESSITRIEFQTANPNIRIIWFVQANSSTTDLSGDSNEQPG